MQIKVNNSETFVIKAMSLFNNNRDCFFIKNDSQFNTLLKELDSILGNNWYKNIKNYKSNCYIVKDKILKLKLMCFPEKINYTNNMVKTYYRKNYRFTCEDKILNVGIEIQKFIFNDDKCSKDELYSVYEELRKQDYIWMDAKVSNIKKENGKIYIVDLDYIYKIDEADYSNQNPLSKKFEEQYLKSIN